MSGTAEYPGIRSIHLQGGCRAVDVENQQIQLQPHASNGRIASFPLPSYPAAYKVLHMAGFQVLGVDFYQQVEQLDGRRLPSWRAYNFIGKTAWPCAEQADLWSFIAHAAFEQKNGMLWDIASRIRQQLRTCDWRLRQLSECYRDQLVATVAAKSFEEGKRFKDGFTWLGYLAIQSFLVDACVLRDYLAEYRALILSQAGAHVFKNKITRISSLKKQYLDKITPSLPVDKVLATAVQPGAWLYNIGSYRDLVVHTAPLAQADKSLYAVCTSLRLDAETTLPSIKLPIPPDPEQITERRTSGKHFDDPELNYARLLNSLKDPSSAADGLQFAHSALAHLAVLAMELSAISSVKPKQMVLTEKDILDIKITSGGPDNKA